MHYKFNPFERAVGVFITGTIVGSLFIGVGIAIKKNWFEEKDFYSAYTNSANNIRVGAVVQIAGMKVGNIEQVELARNQKIKVTFSVLKKYNTSITDGAKVQFVRPFIIGDKIINITQGELGGQSLASGAIIPLEETPDLLDLISGDKIQPMIAKVDLILTNANDALMLGKDLASQVGSKKQLQTTMANVAYASDQLKKVLPHFVNNTPEMAKNVTEMVTNLTALTKGMRELQPFLAEVVKTMPEGSKRAVEALNESVTVLRAMQNSFLLRGSVQEMKKDEKKDEEKKDDTRVIASEDQERT